MNLITQDGTRNGIHKQIAENICTRLIRVDHLFIYLFIQSIPKKSANNSIYELI